MVVTSSAMPFLKPAVQYHAANDPPKTTQRPWKTGKWRRAPFSGLLALLVALLSGLATVIVLKESDGKPLNQWRVHGHDVQPTVVISVLVTLANSLFRYAFSEGARISWWVKSLGGASIGELHRSWDSSQSVLPIFMPWKHIGITAIASLATLVLLIDGPLLQRASTIGDVSTQTWANLNVPISPNPFTRGATGIFSDHVSLTALYTPLFTKVLQQYRAREPIVLPDFGCRGKCELTVEAPGFDIDCEQWESPYRLMSPTEYMHYLNSNQTNATDVSAPRQVMFAANVTTDLQMQDTWLKLRNYRTGVPTNASYPDSLLYANMMLSSMVKSTPGARGKLSWRSCVLTEAVQRYSLVVENTTVSLESPSLQKNYTVYKVQRYPETAGQGNWPNTVGGFWLSTHNGYAGKARLETDPGWYSVRTESASPLIYMAGNGVSDTATTVDVVWKDPIDDMISEIRELSLRTAIATNTQNPYLSDKPWTDNFADILSPNLTGTERKLSQEVSTLMTYDETVYKTDFNWSIGALIVIGITFFTIVPIFNHWWILGRDVSMSPIETAKAFDAPFLRQADDNSKVSELIRDVGDQRVQYGAALSWSGGEPYRASELQKGPVVTEIGEEDSNAPRLRRLHFGKEGTVEMPVERETFAFCVGSGTIQHVRPVYTVSDLSSSSEVQKF